MLYFKNSELTSTYHVALNTVLNWIKAAQSGKVDLELVINNGRTYIANSTANVAALEQLASARKKYRNTRTARTISPNPEFYKIFSREEVQDIIWSLEVRREIPRAYNYFAEGARYWDEYSHQLADSETPNLMNRQLALMGSNLGYLDTLTAQYSRVNVVDIGTGNAMAVRPLLQHLLDQGVLGRYIGMDISTEMMKVAAANINAWFGDKVSMESHKIDIAHERFGHIIADEYLDDNTDSTMNIVLFLGGTLGNLRSPDDALAVIANSLGRRDILMLSYKLDSNRTRRQFDFSTSPHNSVLAPIHRYMLDLLNIDESLYEVEMGFHPDRHARFTRVHLKVSLHIEFELDGGVRTIELEKGDSILLWYFWQQTMPEASQQLLDNNFYPVLLSQTRDKEYLLAIAQLELSAAL